MAAAARVTTSPYKTRKGRTATVQPLTINISSNVDTDTTAALQVQYLRARAFASASLAAAVAEMAWGVRHA